MRPERVTRDTSRELLRSSEWMIRLIQRTHRRTIHGRPKPQYHEGKRAVNRNKNFFEIKVEFVSNLRVAVDVGGTFTDVCVFDESSHQIQVAKVPSTPD